MRTGLRTLALGAVSFEALPFHVFLLLSFAAALGGLGPGVADPDYFWHLATGRYIDATGTIPDFDPFAFSSQGLAWVLHEWPFQYLLYKLYQAFGHGGPLFLAALLAAAALFLTYRSARLFLENQTLCLVLTLLPAAPFLAFLSPRPHLASFLFFALALHLLLRAKYFGARRGLLWLGPVMLLWVNLHGGFLAGIGLITAFLLAEAVRALLFRDPENGGWSLVSWLAIGLGAGLLGACVNLDGPARLLYPFEVVGMATNRFILEWQPLSADEFLARVFLGAVALYLLLAVWGRRRPDLLEAALPLALSFAALVAVRHIPLALMALLPIAARLLAAQLEAPETAGLRAPWRRLPEGLRALGRARIPNRRIDGLLSLAVLVAALALFPFALEANRSEERWPLKAVADHLEENRYGERMMNQYGEGGYLIWRLYPRQKVFIDGRADLYRPEFLQEYFSVTAARGDWRAFMKRWEFDHVVAPRDMPLVAVLLASGAFLEAARVGDHVILTPASAAAGGEGKP